MAVTNGYCTVQQVRDQLGDVSSRASEDQIERAINAVSRAIDRWCGRRFWLDGTATIRRYRPRNPYSVLIEDIGSIDGLAVETGHGDGALTGWTEDDFLLEPLDAVAEGAAYAWWKITAIGGKTFPVGSRRPGLRVTALHGWSATPDEVTEAAILKAAALWKRKDAVWGVADFGEYGAVRISRRDGDVIELLGGFARATPPEV